MTKLAKITEATTIYGNGTVWIGGGESGTIRLKECNFDFERLDRKCESEWWATQEVIVAVGAGLSSVQALIQLKQVVREIQRQETKRKRSARAARRGWSV